VGWLFAAAPPASAHALPVSSNPPAGATLAQPPTRVSITFGEKPDPRLSSIQVLDGSGSPQQVGRATAATGQAQTLEVAVGSLARGVYTVAWRTVSAVDGHLATGSFAFGVGITPTGAAASRGLIRSPPVSDLAVLYRWLIYAGLMGLVGAAEIGLLISRRSSPTSGPGRRLVLFARAAWILAAAGVVGLADQLRSADGISQSQFWGSSVGHQFAYRAVPVALAGIALVVTGRRSVKRAALVVAGVAGLAAMLGDVEASHAAGERSSTWFHVATQWLHFASAGVWLGGLAAVVATAGTLEADDRRRLAVRFSNIAVASVIVLAGTGLLRGLDEIRTWHGLFSTTFGRWAVVKISLLALLVALGFSQRRLGVPSVVNRGGRVLRRLGTAELGLAAIVLVAAGSLQSLAPPVSTRQPPLPSVLASGHDFATTVTLRLQVSPGLPGFNRFTLRVLDYDTHQPVAASAVTLTFDQPTDSLLGPSTLELTPLGSGLYSATAPNLSFPGTWSVTALVQQPSGSAEVPLSITTRATPVRIDAVRSPGLPTVYTIHATPTASIQVYLDPGRSGFNEFHVTLIGADRNELPASGVGVTASRMNAPAAPVVVRRLDNVGHFVADLPAATAGSYHFSIDANTDQGPVHGNIAIPVT
jgi:copper transport protein